jgi:hypothetical protein
MSTYANAERKKVPRYPRLQATEIGASLHRVGTYLEDAGRRCKNIMAIARPRRAAASAHDRLYHEGGAANLDAQGRFAARSAVEELLRQCGHQDR